MAALLVAVTAAAQTYDKFLIPVAIGNGGAGAEGSQWSSVLFVHNGESGTRDFLADILCHTDCPPRELPPTMTTGVTFRAQPVGNPGLVVYVETPSEAVTFNVRVRELTRQAETAGNRRKRRRISFLADHAHQHPDR